MNSKLLPLATVLVLTGCAQYSVGPKAHDPAGKSLHLARSKRTPLEERAALYLQAAAASAPSPGSRPSAVYNSAAVELTALLRTADGGRLWNHPATFRTNGESYRLNFAPAVKQGLWSPNFFTALIPAQDVPIKSVKRVNRQEGVGGALVGVRKTSPLEPFSPRVGVTAPVTATLEFRGHDATLALRNPSIAPNASIGGASRPLEANFSAPLAYYPNTNETIAGLMGAIRVSHYMDTTGMYRLGPYDPNRIPLILVHGLISTPRMWRNVVNELETDPVLRGRFQPWVFGYPTGNPVAYSALRFREELAKAGQIYGFPKGYVVVGHSMGGIVSRMQLTTLDRAAWKAAPGAPVEKLFSQMSSDSLVYRAMIFKANPDARRAIFICTPHRGSNLALSSVGDIGMRLISLPATLTSAISKSMVSSLSAFTGQSKGFPNSVTSLSPRNPTLAVLDAHPMNVPHHTILGDRGKNDSPNSSDGIVAYWSSHLKTAQSEKVVPGPHGACELPQTIEELKRILHLHLQSTH